LPRASAIEALMRAFMRFWGSHAAAAVSAPRITLGFKPDHYEIIGYIRDALIILGIVAVGMYFLSYPDKFDAALNFMLGRQHGALSIQIL
jgi:hypothetical protein